MKKFLNLFYFLFFVFSVNAQVFGGLQNDFSNSIIEIDKNKFITVGASKSYTLNHDNNVLITYFNNNSFHTKVVGDKNHDEAYSISKLSNGNYIIAGFTNEGFDVGYGEDNPLLIKINKKMNVIWAKSYYFPSFDMAINAKELSDGNILAIGYTRSTKGSKNRDILLLKVDSKGDTIWHKKYDSYGDDYGYDFIEKENRNIIILAESGGYFSYNQTNLKDVDNSDILLIEISENGDEIKRTLIGGTGNELCRKIIKSPKNDGYYIIGSTQSYGEGNFDVYLVKIDNNLNVLWEKTYGTDKIEYGNSFVINQGNIYISATYTTQSYKPTASVVVANLEGDFIYQEKIDIDSFSYANDIIISQDNKIILTGSAGREKYELDGFIVSLNKKNGQQEEKCAIEIKVFPNPVTNIQEITFEIMLSNKIFGVSYKFEIYDSAASRIFSTTDYSCIIRYNTALLKNGIYFYKFYFNNNCSVSGKFIIDK